jgi:hypothetical protein
MVRGANSRANWQKHVFGKALQMRDWTSGEFTEVALREQGRHLLLKGGGSHARNEHGLQPRYAHPFAVDCSAALPVLSVRR